MAWKTVDGVRVELSSDELAEHVDSLLPTPDLKEQLKAYVAELRYRKEVGGITVFGMQVGTTDSSKLKLLGARRRAELDAELVEEWDEGGGAISITAAQIITISDAVGEHVSRCFRKSKEIKEAIDADVITTVEQIDASFASLNTSYNDE